jgi:hypothetical protein
LVVIRIFFASDASRAALTEFWQICNCDYDH